MTVPHAAKAMTGPTPARLRVARSAANPLALAKLTPPMLPELVARPQLLAQLDQARATGAKVVWVQAAPGAGKTTLAASYAAAQQQPTLWYQLTASDADPATWFQFLTQAIQQLAPRFRKPMPTLEPAYLPDLPGFTRRYFEQFFTRLKTPALLIFDNYHELPGDSVVQTLMTEVLGMLPPGVFGLVASRQAPPPMLATGIANRTVREFPATALAFDLKETEQLVTLHERDTMHETAAWAQQLQAQTQGWVAGMILLSTHQQTTQAVPLPSSRLVLPTQVAADDPILMDYFTHEALAGLTPVIRKLLLQTAMLSAFTPAMAETLTGTSAAGYELRRLARVRYFVESRERDGQLVLQYHPLFRQFLCHQAARDLGPSAWRELQAQAGALLLEAGWLDEAVHLLFDAKAVPRAIELILTEAPSVMQQGRGQTLAGWLGRVPADALAREPYLLYWQGMSYLFVDPAESLRSFTAASQRFERSQQAVGHMLAASGAIQAITQTWGPFDQLDPWLEVIEVHWEHEATSMPPDQQVTILMARVQGLFWRQLTPAVLQVWIDRVEAILPRMTHLNDLPLLIYWLLYCLNWFGQPEQGQRLMNQASQCLASHRLSPTSEVLWEATQANALWLTGNFIQANFHIRQGMALLQQHGFSGSAGPLLAVGVILNLNQGNLKGAQQLLTQSQPLMGQLGVGFQVAHYTLAGWHAALNEEFDEALSLANKAEDLGSKVQTFYFQVASAMSRLAILLASGKYSQVKAPLNRLHAKLQKTDLRTLLYTYHQLRAFLSLAEGDRTTTCRELQLGFTLGRKHTIVFSTEIWFPKLLVPCCVVALEEHIEPEYVHRLIRAKGLTLDARTAQTTAWPWPIRIQTLGRFVITIEDAPLTFGRKAPLMPLRFLKLILCQGGQEIPLTRLADELWPDAEGDAAYRSMLTTLGRLRKLLGREEALLVQGGLLSLNFEISWVDSLAFEGFIQRGKTLRNAGKHREAEEAETRANTLYQGDFLATDSELSWVLPVRERLAKHYAQLTKAAVS